jgi:hypothetical protein
MKKQIILGCLLFVIVLFVIICYVLFAPVKYALKQSELDRKKTPYYLVQWVQITGSSWAIIGDHNGRYENVEYITINGEAPSVVKNYAVATGPNTYICYGNYLGESIISDSGDSVSVYQFTDWDILYPVKRNGLIPFLSESYLCKLDFQ